METCTKLVLFQLFLLSLFIVATGGPLKALRRGKIPKGMPENMTVEEFLESRGQGRMKQARIRRLARRIKQRFLKPGVQLGRDVDDRFDDLVFTEEQLQAVDEMTSPSAGSDDHRRRKRKVVNFDVFGKWQPPTIYYVLDGTQTEEQKAYIQKAVNHFAQKTCIRFAEGADDIDNVPYIFITRNDSDGCWSYLGRINTVGPQLLNLAANCFYSDGRYGTVIHELGHALGLIHEHGRIDRDDYVTIVLESIKPGTEAAFAKWSPANSDENITAKVHYDYGSIMHYGSKAFSADHNDTIVPKKPIYTGTLGQRHYLSFWDAYAINLAYCKDACAGVPEPTCQRGGYQDPNNCGSCICPEGFAGQFCEEDDANTAACSDAGHISLGSEQQCIEIQTPSTSYDFVCDWHIEADPGSRIEFWFERLNLAHFTTNACYDFVEVKYENNLADRGPRFCIFQSSERFTSNMNELMVSFRGYLQTTGYEYDFKLCFQVEGSTGPTPETPTETDVTTAASGSNGDHKKENRIHKNRNKKLQKKLELVFGSTTPSNLPEKRKALRKLLRSLLESGGVHGEGGSL